MSKNKTFSNPMLDFEDEKEESLSFKEDLDLPDLLEIDDEDSSVGSSELVTDSLLSEDFDFPEENVKYVDSLFDGVAKTSTNSLSGRDSSERDSFMPPGEPVAPIKSSRSSDSFFVDSPVEVIDEIEVSDFSLSVVDEKSMYKKRDDFFASATSSIINIDLDSILSRAFDMGASDVDLTSDDYVAFTILGEVHRMEEFGTLKPQDLLRLQQDIITNVLDAEFAETKELDTSYVLKNGRHKGRRTRLSIGRSFGKVFLVFRTIADKIPTLNSLGAEPELYRLAGLSRGLVLVNGPTGGGKSTTLAAMINQINYSRRYKIVTIEDPVEFIYGNDGLSVIHQREIGIDSRSFSSALKSAFRQHPNVILLGEVRDAQEMTPLLTAAESGHLAISTMHTNNAASTLQRFMKIYQDNDLSKNLEMLSQVSRAYVNQNLLLSIDEKSRFAVREILMINNEVRDLIAEGDVKGINEYQFRNKATMEHGLVKAVLDGRADLNVARSKAPDEFLFNSIYEDSI